MNRGTCHSKVPENNDALFMPFFHNYSRYYQSYYYVTPGNNACKIEHIKLLRQVKVKQSPDRPWGFDEVEGPRFQDNQHMKVVRLSALPTSHLYLPRNIPGWVDPRVIVWTERLYQWKIPVTPLGIRRTTYQLVAHWLNQLCHHVPPH